MPPSRPRTFSIKTPRVPSRSCDETLYLKIKEFSPILDLVFRMSSKPLFFAVLPLTIIPSGELSFRKTIGNLAWLPAMASMHRATQVTFCMPSL